MREFYTFIEGDVLARGLRKRSKSSRNHLEMIKVLNVRCGEYGLERYEPIEILSKNYFHTQYGFSLDFPFPQIFLGIGKGFVLNKSSIYELNLDTIVEDTSFTLTEIDTYDVGTGNAVTRPLSGTRWNFIDFEDVYMFVNGTSSIFAANRWIDNYKANTVHTGKVFSENTVSINTGCKHKGRTVLGGFNPTNFWNNDWKKFWLDWTVKHKTGMQFDATLGLGENFIMWSMSGGGDMFKLFFNRLAITGIYKGQTNFGDTDPLIFSMMKRGDAGFMPVSWNGAILEIKPIGNDILVYGNNGISAMQWYNDPAPTYGEKVLSSIGIANPGAMGGDDQVQVFVDKKGVAWRVTADRKIERLGYEEWLQPMVEEGIYISYNPDLKDFYISNSSKSYLLSPFGLSEITQKITSIIYYNRPLAIGE